jgi:hypothetical protein
LLLIPEAPNAGPVQDQRRANVERVAGLPLPGPEDSRTEAGAEKYKAAVLVLRAKTSDHAKFPLVFAENKNYGFERNVLGIRGIGIALAVMSLLVLLVGVLVAARWDVQLSLRSLSVAALFCLFFLWFWISWPTPARVKEAGMRYAQRLFDAAVGL